jgi:two-component system response regulator NreC
MLSTEEDICVVGEAACGTELFAALEDTETDVILLDVIMPGMSGIEIARLLRTTRPDVRILVLSSENTQQTLTELVEAGIDGFISKQKSAGPDELPNAIRSIYYGSEYFGRDMAAILYRIYVSIKKKTEATVEFTDRECEIIALCREGLRSKEIADRLFVSVRTIDTHKTNIFGKLGINNMKEVVKYAFEHGIIRIDG